MEQLYPLPPIIERTTNYSAFKFLEFNREVSPSNVKKLVKLNREHFNLNNFPIVVSRNLEIIDGQHRFEACRQLGCPIYYIFDHSEKTSVSSVHRVNIAGRKHSLSDLAHMLIKDGHPVLVKANRFFLKWEHSFTFAEIIPLLHSLQNSGVKEAVNNNAYTVKNEAVLEEICQTLDKYKFENYKKRAILPAICRIVSKHDVAPALFIKRLHRNRAMFSPAGSIAIIMVSAIKAYNYGLKTNRLQQENL